VALIAGALLLTSPALAGKEPPLVVVVCSNSDAPFVRRLAAELSLFGYRVEVAERREGEPELTSVLTSRGGAALISVDQGRQTAEVIVAAPPGGAAEHRDVERLDPRRRADTNAAVLAERFRARLTELGIAPGTEPVSPPAPPPPRPPPRAVPSPSKEPRAWVGAGVGVSAGGLGPLPEASLELRVFPVRWLSTSAFGKVSLRRGHVDANEGSADVRLLTGGLTVDAYPVRGKISAHVGVGVVLIDAEMSGRAAPPWLGREDSVLVPGGLLQGGATLRLTPRVSAEVRGFVGACAPRVAVRIAEQKAADYGQPFVGATLGILVGLF
jgi:hypothetical protein